MQQLINIKLWTERKALSRGRWQVENWPVKYSMSWGNKNSWRDEKKKISRAQRRTMMIYQLER
jgi:hypothetical protein